MVEIYDYNYKFCFLTQWFDYEAAFSKRFLLNYYPYDNTLELFDIDTDRIFLKRYRVDDLSMRDFFVGNTIRVYGRHIIIKDYADGRTKQIVGKARQHTFAFIKPSVFDKCGEIINLIEQKDFQITNLKMCHLTQNQIIEFYQSDEKDLSLPFLVENMISGPVIALDLVGDDGIERWKKIMGPEDPLEARKTDPQSLRALYGLEKFSNGFHGSDSTENYEKEANCLFKNSIKYNLQLNNSTCCVIKPHAIREGNLGNILTEITKKFKITAMQMFHLTKLNAEEFLEIYQDVVKDFQSLLSSFLEGPVVALEIAGNYDNVYSEFRKYAGPWDSDIARQIRPHTIRAKFGTGLYRNAIHCTDLEEDTVLDLEFFFKILNQ